MKIFLSSLMLGLGNSFVTEIKEKIFSDLKKFTFMFQWLIGLCTCCFLCLYQPFMQLWVGGKYLLEFGTVICLCVYFYIFSRIVKVYFFYICCRGDYLLFV